jgi:Tol biopolymer transport system component
MASVYLCEDLKHDRKVALKLLKPELAAVLGAERFVVEIKTTASLQHPHILPLFDSGTADGFLFYVMPFIEGETLRDKLNRETQLGVDEAVRIAREVLDALQYAHEHGIVHRDVKPENILLHGGHAMVADFGIALAVSAAAGGRMTETGLSLGTPHYMSPEQATAEKEITARSDVYSLASVLYEMLAGEPPHTGGSAQAIIMKIIAEPVKPVAALRKSVPPNVAAAVAKALEKVPADRFDSAKAFGEALGNPAYTSERSAAAANHAMAGSRGVSLSVFAASMVLVTGIAVVATWWTMARRADVPVAVQFSFSTIPNQPLSVTAGRNLALSPDGRTLVLSTADSTGRYRLFSRAIDDLRLQPIPGTEDASWPVFSYDGRSIAFVVGRELMKIPLAGGVRTPLAEIGTYHGASWGPNGIIVSSDGKLVLVPNDGGAPAPALAGDGVSGAWPVLLAGGKSVLYATTLGPDGTLAVADLATGHKTKIGLTGIAIGVAGGELVFATADGALRAVPFDARRFREMGTGSVVVGDVARNGNGEVKAALSAQGTLAYLAGGGQAQPVLVDMRGGARPLPVPPGTLTSVRVSPNGLRVAVDLSSNGRADIYVFDLKSGAQQRVTSDGASNIRPAWSPDGTRILYRKTAADGKSTLWWQPADLSGAAEQLIASAGKDIWQGELTPDGKTVVYRTGSLASADIWYRRVSGDTAEKGIATAKFSENAPRISPDGRWVAYSSDVSGSNQVYVQPFPGPGAQIPVSVSGGTVPIWSRDSRRLFFFNGGRMMAASVTTNPSFSVTATELLFEGNYQTGVGHPSYDVMPDGKSFVMLRPVSGRSEEIVVIHNWAGAAAKK